MAVPGLRCGMQDHQLPHMGSLLAACGIWFSDQGSNPGPLHREHGVLATAPPGRSLKVPACLCRCTSHYFLIDCLHAEKLFSIYVSLTAHIPFFYSTLNIYFLMLFIFDSFFQTSSNPFSSVKLSQIHQPLPSFLSLGQWFITWSEHQSYLACIFYACSSLRLRDSNSLVLSLGLHGSENVPVEE